MRSLYDNLDNDENLAVSIHKSILRSRQDDWKGNKIKEKQVKNAIRKALAKLDIEDESEVEKIFKLAVNQDEY
jgi:type I restriction enzyme R subunit